MSRSALDLFVPQSIQLPPRPRFGAGTSLFYKSEDVLDALQVGEKLRERTELAISSEELSVWSCVKGAFEENVFDGLQGVATGAGDLVLGVEGVEALCELACESMCCNVAKKCHISKSGELNCVPCSSIAVSS